MQTFRTHTGEIVSGEKLTNALNKVADDMIANAYAIKEENLYASHVTEKDKEAYLKSGIAYAELVRKGSVDNFTVWQRVNTALTGECVALLSK